MSTVFTDIITIADGPFGTTNINLDNSTITLVANSTLALTVNPTGSVVVGSQTANTSADFFVNGSMASSMNNSSAISGTIILDFSTSNNFMINMIGTTNLGAVVNATAGQSGIIFLVQPSFTNVSVTFDHSWKWPNGIAPTATAITSAIDGVAYIVLSTSPLMIAAQYISNFS